MRSQGASEHVGSLSESPVVSDRSRLTLRVRFNKIPSKVWNLLIDHICDVIPPTLHLLIERVKRIKIAGKLSRRGRCKVHRQPQSHTVRAEGISDPCNAVKVGGVEDGLIGIDVVDHDSVDTDGGQDAGILGRTGQVFAHDTVPEKDTVTSVSTLDGSVCTSISEIVPLIDPAYRSIGVGSKSDFGDVSLAEHAEVFERTVDGTTLVLSENEHLVSGGIKIEAIFHEFWNVVAVSAGLRVGVHSADDEIRRTITGFVLHFAVAAEDTTDAVSQLLASGVDGADLGAVQGVNRRRDRTMILLGIGDRGVAEPGVQSILCGSDAQGE